MTYEECRKNIDGKMFELVCAVEVEEREKWIEKLVREYSTLSKAKEAVDKQIPKKPIITIDGFFNGQPIYNTWGCPNCGKVNETDFEDYEYCPICGQALDWSEDNA